MAIVRFPAMSFDASGNLGDINYTKWKGMNIARTTYSYTDPNTAAQITSRGHMTTVSQAWGGTLSADDRQTWVQRARSVTFFDRFGQPYEPSGYQVYLKWNLQILQNGGSLLQEAPIGGEKAIVNEISAVSVGAPGEMEVKLTKDGILFPECASLVYFQAGPYDSGGRHPIAPEYRKAKVTTPPAKYTAKSLTAFKYYWWKAFGVFPSGIRTNDFEVQAVVPI
jgi:hypothetical protein